MMCPHPYNVTVGEQLSGKSSQSARAAIRGHSAYSSSSFTVAVQRHHLFALPLRGETSFEQVQVKTFE